ncbi:MAG: cyclic pyranopterin monophosphate synthase MoaC [Bacteroidota bacterium]
MSDKFTHLDDEGKPSMVNVGQKMPSARMAKARSIVLLGEALMDRLENDDIQTPKGPVFQTAIIAGIMAAKKTGELIPLCHPIGLDNCSIDITINEQKAIIIDCTTHIFAKTGVEMEALTGASVAALTIYDMCKAFSHDIRIVETKLMEKRGGKKDFVRED